MPPDPKRSEDLDAMTVKDHLRTLRGGRLRTRRRKPPEIDDMQVDELDELTVDDHYHQMKRPEE